jgi:tRNA pseudouridine55 synthase
MSAQSAKPRRFDRDVDGILLLDKPTGMSSNAALQQARALFRALKAGHAGSLDPMASGMLPVCFGQATKVCAYLLDSGKSYRFTARLGERSDTGDADGTIVERADVPPLNEDGIRAMLSANIGEQRQVPPMYSALKHEGRRLYELARRGEEVERAPRTIRIESLDYIRFDGRDLELSVRCSKGTYVRTLAEDLAKQLGTLAHLVALRRLSVDPFGALPMFTLEQLLERAADGIERLDGCLLPSDRAIPHLPAVTVDVVGQAALTHGQAAHCSGDPLAPELAERVVRIYGPSRRFLGLGELMPNGDVQPRRLMVGVD